MKKFKQYIGLLIIPFCMGLVSCDDKDDVMDSPDQTVIYEMKIINGGFSGDSIIIGTVDENMKKIRFPRVHPTTDLSAVRFEAKVSDRAHLDADTYNFTMPAGSSEYEKVISVVNGKRKREYFATIRWDVPVFGADFEKALMYDYSSNSTENAVYPDFSGSTTRSSDFDGHHALFVSRFGGVNPHLLALEDIKSKNVSNKKRLSLLDASGQSIISGGIFMISAGRLAQGRTYICNMSSAAAGAPLKVYYWETPTSPVKLMYSYNGNTGGGRYGDNMSMYLDASGNGHMFFENNATNKILKVEVTNFTTIGTTTEIYPKGSTGAGGGQYATFNNIEGTSQFLYTGYESPIMLVSADGGLETKLTNSVPQRASDARILTFNEERYLLVTTANRRDPDPTTTVYVYDITKGNGIKEAFEILESTKPKPVFEKSLGGGPSTAPGVNTGWGVVDGVLYIYGAADNAGFAVMELMEKSQD